MLLPEGRTNYKGFFLKLATFSDLRAAKYRLLYFNTVDGKINLICKNYALL